VRLVTHKHVLTTPSQDLYPGNGNLLPTWAVNAPFAPQVEALVTRCNRQPGRMRHRLHLIPTLCGGLANLGGYDTVCTPHRIRHCLHPGAKLTCFSSPGWADATQFGPLGKVAMSSRVTNLGGNNTVCTWRMIHPNKSNRPTHPDTTCYTRKCSTLRCTA
jgi:hypothetical protein